MSKGDWLEVGLKILGAYFLVVGIAGIWRAMLALSMGPSRTDAQISAGIALLATPLVELVAGIVLILAKWGSQSVTTRKPPLPSYLEDSLGKMERGEESKSEHPEKSTMRHIRGPGVFLAQFLRDQEPFSSLDGLARWFAGMCYKGLQIPSWDRRTLDLDRAAESRGYCEDYKAKLAGLGLEITEVSGHLQGQVLAIHPTYALGFAGFYPAGLDDKGRAEWATAELKKVIRALANFGLKNIPTLSGGFAWHLAYPWPQRPPGLIDEAFTELARRWRPLLDLAKDHGCVFGYELHPGSDLFDGATFDRFLEHTAEHPAACIHYDPSHFLLQQLDYLEFIRIYGKRISGFHVKDAEFRPSGRVGVYGGYHGWSQRAGRFRSLGDGQVDFNQVFTLLTEAGFEGWAVMEWECCVKSPEQGAREGAPFIAQHIIEATDIAFDDFAGGKSDVATNRKMLGL